MGIYDREYYQDEGMPRGPRVYSAIAILMIINIGVYLIDAFTESNGESAGGLMNLLALQSENLARPWMWWQLLTYGFGHSPISEPNGIWHLAFNMLGLFMFGRQVEAHYGRAEFLRFYLVAVVFAGLIWLLYVNLTGVSPRAMLGASGAVVAVVMLFIFHFRNQTLLLFGIVPMQAWLLGVIFIGLEILNALNPNSKIAWEAHLAGAGFAALYFRLRWNFRFLERFKLPQMGRRSQLKIHRPKEDRLKRDADRLLAKIHSEGESSLTRAERRTLEKYSRLMREQKKASASSDE